MAAYLFSFAVPYLLAAIAVTSLLHLAGAQIAKPPARIIIFFMPLILILIPVRHIPAARFLTGLNANFSITLTILLLDLLLKRIRGPRLLDRRTLRTISISGLILGVFLYGAAMNLIPLDLYRLGWDPGLFLIFLFLVTVLLILTGNRTGFILAACVAAYAFRLLESDNLWDYLVDPFLVIWCLAETIAQSARLMRKTPP